MRSRHFRIILCFAAIMILIAAAALSTSVSAANSVTATGMDELRSYLESDQDLTITIGRDIIHTVDARTAGDYFITLGRGNKTLDLAGSNLELNAVYSSGSNVNRLVTFFCVPKGAKLTVNDSSVSGSGTIWCYGKMHSPTKKYSNYDVDYRNVIAVNGGDLTVNGGTVESGRTKSTWIYKGVNIFDWDKQEFEMITSAMYRFDGNAYEIIGGDAITLYDGSVTVNGGKICGRGYRRLESEFDISAILNYNITRAAAIYAVKGTLTINGGVIYGAGNANCLDVRTGADVTIKSGFFDLQSLDPVVCPVEAPYVNAAKSDVAVMEVGWKYEHSWGATTVNNAAGAGGFGIPDRALGDDNVLEYDGKPLARDKWTGEILYKSDRTTHTLSISAKAGGTVYHVDRSDVDEGTLITSVDLLGTPARDMSVNSESTVCEDDRVNSVLTAWYRDGELITGPHVVRFGNYVASATVYAKRGYKFSADTGFSIFGDEPVNVKISDNGSYATVLSPAYYFECDHFFNEDATIHYDDVCHYEICSVCGQRLTEEQHVFGGGVDSGGHTIYNCIGCGYSYEEENGKRKADFLYLELPVAVEGDKIPTPQLREGYDALAAVTSYEIVMKEAGEPDVAVHPGDAYQSGHMYRFTVRVRAADGVYFPAGAKMNCAATAVADLDVGDDVIIGIYNVYCYPATTGTAVLPEMYAGETIGGYLDSVEAYVNGDPVSNIQATIKVHGAPENAFVTYNIHTGWKLVKGADSLETLFARVISPQTAYDVSFNFSTNSTYVADSRVICRSSASYDGLKIRGGQTWFDISGIVVSGSDKISEIAIVGVTPPCAGEKPQNDFDLPNRYAFEKVEGKWSTDETFEEGSVYAFAALVSLRDGFTLTDGLTATVNGMPAEVSAIGRTVVVRYDFPKTQKGVIVSTSGGLPCSGGDDCPGKTFRDMPPKGDWAHDPIDWAVVYGITSGTSATSFSPNSGCTRAQVVTFLWRAAGKPEPSGSYNPFSDVRSDAYYYTAVLWAVEQNITAGTSADRFSPDATCTRAQIVTFLWRYEGEPEPGTSGDPFSDVKANDYFAKAVLWAAENGVTAGTTATTFSPGSTCTRAQIVTFLYRSVVK